MGMGGGDVAERVSSLLQRLTLEPFGVGVNEHGV